MNNMIAERRDWCISGSGFGSSDSGLYCESCGEALLTPESVAAVQEIFKKEGSDAWFFYKAEEILPENISCSSCGERKFRKEQDIMDVWFDSGSSHAAVVNQREELNWPADLYLEGSDQFRGWFQSSLLTAVAVMGKPPYRNVLSHGWVVDGEGEMSKSLGNVIVPEDVIKIMVPYSAPCFSADFTSDVHLSSDILKQLSEIYQNTQHLQVPSGHCSDFVPARPVDYSQLRRSIAGRCTVYISWSKTTRAFENYEYHQCFMHCITCCSDMSNFYFDTKDRLYVLAEDSRSRRAVQTYWQRFSRPLRF